MEPWRSSPGSQQRDNSSYPEPDDYNLKSHTLLLMTYLNPYPANVENMVSS
jgi:hypothetical protein